MTSEEYPEHLKVETRLVDERCENVPTLKFELGGEHHTVEVEQSTVT